MATAIAAGALNGSEHGGVDNHHGAGDGRHARRHQAEQLALRQAAHVGSYEERGLGHADENIGGHTDAFGAADAHQALHEAAHQTDDPRQQPVVVEDAGQGGYEDDDAAYFQRHYGAVPGGEVGVADTHEEEGLIGLQGRVPEELRQVAGQGEDRSPDSGQQQQGGQQELEEGSHPNDPEWNPSSSPRQPGHAKEKDVTDCTVKDGHVLASGRPSGSGSSGSNWGKQASTLATTSCRGPSVGTPIAPSHTGTEVTALAKLSNQGLSLRDPRAARRRRQVSRSGASR